MSKNRIKVLHVIPSIAPEMGGPSYAILGMIKNLRVNGVDAEIATTTYGMSKELSARPGEKVLHEAAPVYFFKHSNVGTKHFLFSRKFAGWAWRNINKYDVIHCHYVFSFLPSYACTIARRFRVPYIMRTCGQLTKLALEKSRIRKKIYSSLWENYNFNKAKFIHCTSAPEREEASNLFPETPILVLPVSVNPIPGIPDAKNILRQKYNIPKSTAILLFLSRKVPMKRPEILIDALARAKDLCDFHLIFAGPSETGYNDYLTHLIDRAGIHANVTTIGMVVGHEKNILFQGADVFVSPSYFESFGIASAEAMAIGIPVIVSAGHMLSDTILTNNAGLVFSDREGLTEAIVKLCRSKELRERLGQCAKFIIKSEYSNETVCLKMTAAYKSITGA